MLLFEPNFNSAHFQSITFGSQLAVLTCRADGEAVAPIIMTPLRSAADDPRIGQCSVQEHEPMYKLASPGRMPLMRCDTVVPQADQP